MKYCGEVTDYNYIYATIGLNKIFRHLDDDERRIYSDEVPMASKLNISFSKFMGLRRSKGL